MLSTPIHLGPFDGVPMPDFSVDPQFDALTRLTAHVLNAPQAFINFFDNARTWCKSAWGTHRVNRAHRDSLCALAAQGTDDIVVFDPAGDAELKLHPEFADSESVVCYMAFIIRSPAGLALGTLCVKDHNSRTLESGESQTLRLLGGMVAGLLAAIKDRTALEANTRRNRDQFLAMLAHELRAPMAPVLTAVQVMTRFDVPETKRDWAKRMVARHVRHMGQIVDRLLSTSLISTGAIEVYPESVRVDDIIDQALEMAEGLILQKKHALTRLVRGDLWVMADRTQCPLMVVNLVMNAAKYTPEGGHISLSAEGDGAAVCIRVADSGIGIARGDLEEIFEVFGQSRQSLDRGQGGMGLGLSLARRLAQWHGGALVARSDGVGKGSEFVLTLPQARPAPSQDARAKPPVTGSAAGTLDILVIDDNADAADALALYLQMSGHQVRTVYRPADALDLFMERQPDIVLSDIGLPEIDGYELVARMRALVGSAPTWYVAITGYGSAADRRRAFKAGFHEHFSKPVDLGKLDEIIESMVRHRDSGAP